jgi:hypothetical protein
LAFILAPLPCNDRERSSCATATVTLTLILTLNQLTINSWSNELVVRQSSVDKNMSTETEGIVGIRNQATNGDGTAA